MAIVDIAKAVSFDTFSGDYGQRTKSGQIPTMWSNELRAFHIRILRKFASWDLRMNMAHKIYDIFRNWTMTKAKR